MSSPPFAGRRCEDHGERRKGRQGASAWVASALRNRMHAVGVNVAARALAAAGKVRAKKTAPKKADPVKGHTTINVLTADEAEKIAAKRRGPRSRSLRAA
jgi:hypothetical protein